jgi:hypothetical protein
MVFGFGFPINWINLLLSIKRHASCTFLKKSVVSCIIFRFDNYSFKKLQLAVTELGAPNFLDVILF